MQLLLLLFCLPALVVVPGGDLKTSARSKKAVAEVRPALEIRLKEKGLSWGAPVFMRLFKGGRQMELWMEKKGRYVLFDTYEICHFSGELGPKLKEGDHQAPEGFYAVTPGAMNPWSSYHLSFNVGYPNRYDRSLGRTGGLIMIHGNCVSIGCFAMTDDKIEEIYALVEAAFQNGATSVPVHIFPFRLTSKNLTLMADSRWIDFWENLKVGYDYFEDNLVPPKVGSRGGRYVFSEPRDRTASRSDH